MKKKKVFLGGLLGISIIAAGITLASCKSIPLTPYESSKTAVPTPTPTIFPSSILAIFSFSEINS